LAQTIDPNFCTQLLQNKGGRQGKGLICCALAHSGDGDGDSRDGDSVDNVATAIVATATVTAAEKATIN
jgi:hypothetical protein